MKIIEGDKIKFYLFSILEEGIVEKVNKDKTLQIILDGIIYPSVTTFTTLPTKSKEIPPWYILK